MNVTIQLHGKPVRVELSASAKRALANRAEPLYAEVQLIFGCMIAKRDLYLSDLPQAWAREHGNFKFTPVLSEPRPEDRWDGRQGWVHEAVAADYPDLSRHEVYASGPPPMIDALKPMVKKHGLPEDRLYYDSFEFAHASAP